MKIIPVKEFVSGAHDNFIQSELLKGNIVIFPSESSYGLAGNALSEEVVRKIHEVKKEPHDKPIGIITDTYLKVENIVNLGKNGKKLLTKFNRTLTILFN